MPVSAGQTLGPLGLWHPSVRRSWLGPWLLWHRGLGLPGASGAGGRPCCQPRRTRKMLLLSPALSHLALAPREGGGRGGRYSSSPAHREFSKDARGCLEDGRRGRGGWAGPPNPPPKKGGGWTTRRRGRIPQCLTTQQLA